MQPAMPLLRASEDPEVARRHPHRHRRQGLLRRRRHARNERRRRGEGACAFSRRRRTLRTSSPACPSRSSPPSTATASVAAPVSLSARIRIASTNASFRLPGSEYGLVVAAATLPRPRRRRAREGAHLHRPQVRRAGSLRLRARHVAPRTRRPHACRPGHGRNHRPHPERRRPGSRSASSMQPPSPRKPAAWKTPPTATPRQPGPGRPLPLRHPKVTGRGRPAGDKRHESALSPASRPRFHLGPRRPLRRHASLRPRRRGAGRSSAPARPRMRRGSGPFVHGVSTYFFSVNRGKKSIMLDLKSAGGARRLSSARRQGRRCHGELLAGHDGAPGPRLRGASARNPRLVYASTSGFGQTGPYRERGAVDVDRPGHGRRHEHDRPRGRPAGARRLLHRRHGRRACSPPSASSPRCRTRPQRPRPARRCRHARLPGRADGERHRPLLRHRRGAGPGRLPPPAQHAVPGLPRQRRLARPRGREGPPVARSSARTLGCDELILDERFADQPRAHPPTTPTWSPSSSQPSARRTVAEWQELSRFCLIGPLEHRRPDGGRPPAPRPRHVRRASPPGPAPP